MIGISVLRIKMSVSFQSSANDPRHIEFISDLTRMSRGEYVRESGRAIEMYGKMGDFAQGDFQRAAQNLEDLRPWIQRASELGEQLDLRFQGVRSFIIWLA